MTATWAYEEPADVKSSTALTFCSMSDFYMSCPAWRDFGPFLTAGTKSPEAIRVHVLVVLHAAVNDTSE